MTQQNGFNNNLSPKRIFIAPLDWGLGHATRCIPIIKAFADKGFEIFIGADKATYILLKEEFPNLNFIKMKGYEIEYSRKIGGLYLKLLAQLPRIFTVILKEKKQLNRIIADYAIHAVVSDNRFGLYSQKVPCIYITHQLSIKTGHWFSSKIATGIHRHFIKKFTHCWIPDNTVNDLAGELSHPKKMPVNAKYLGVLSRFEPLDLPRVYDLMITLSGPEPQRTIFETLLLSQCRNLKMKILFARGLPGKKESPDHGLSHVTMVNHLNAPSLNRALCQSALVIGRSGYTTIMDLAKLGKKGILVPTPGQPEQEYLAEYLMGKGYFYMADQAGFNLIETLEKAGKFNFPAISRGKEDFRTVINEFIEHMK